MRLRPDPISPEILSFIEATVREMMAPYAVREIRIRASEDHDGDPAIFVDIDHDLSTTPVDTKDLRRLSKRILDRLWELGEDRFAYVRHHYHDDQKGTWDR